MNTPAAFDVTGRILIGAFVLSMVPVAWASHRMRRSAKPKASPQPKTTQTVSRSRSHEIAVCASGAAGVVKRRRALKDQTTQALAEPFKKATPEQRKAARQRGFDWRPVR